MKKENTKGLMMTGSFRKTGVTFYVRQGQMIARVSQSMERRSCTRAQFEQRMRMRHTVALWQGLRVCQPMFTQRKTAYLGFASLANRLPAVYVDGRKEMAYASMLMPGIPVSDGTLPTVKQWLGEQRGTAALMTQLTAGDLCKGDRLLLYSAVQRIEGKTPMVRFNVREVAPTEMTTVEGTLALVDAEFADEMKGWALVHVSGDRCSSQGLVTRCTYYQQFTTEEALQAAAESYGGLTE